MPQRFYINKENLDEQFEKLDRNLYEMLDFAYLHEDMVTIIEELMSDWSKENLQSFNTILKDWEDMSEEQKELYEDFDEYIRDFGRWWVELDNLTDEEKINLIERYQITIFYSLHSDTYSYDSIKENIEYNC
jgi:hypothetical protein